MMLISKKNFRIKKYMAKLLETQLIWIIANISSSLFKEKISAKKSKNI